MNKGEIQIRSDGVGKGTRAIFSFSAKDITKNTIHPRLLETRNDNDDSHLIDSQRLIQSVPILKHYVSRSKLDISDKQPLTPRDRILIREPDQS